MLTPPPPPPPPPKFPVLFPRYKINFMLSKCRDAYTAIRGVSSGGGLHPCAFGVGGMAQGPALAEGPAYIILLVFVLFSEEHCQIFPCLRRVFFLKSHNLCLSPPRES